MISLCNYEIRFYISGLAIHIIYLTVNEGVENDLVAAVTGKLSFCLKSYGISLLHFTGFRFLVIQAHLDTAGKLFQVTTV